MPLLTFEPSTMINTVPQTEDTGGGKTAGDRFLSWDNDIFSQPSTPYWTSLGFPLVAFAFSCSVKKKQKGFFTFSLWFLKLLRHCITGKIWVKDNCKYGIDIN